LSWGLSALLYGHLLDCGYLVFLRAQGELTWIPLLISPIACGLSAWLTRRYFRGAVVAVSTLIALAIKGDCTYLDSMRPPGLAFGLGVVAVFAVAALSGLAGGAFAWVFANSARWLPAPLLSMREKRPLTFGLSCGLVVALAGFASGHHTFGSGYAEARDLLQGYIALSWSYPVLKLISLLATSVGGAAGGIFVPHVRDWRGHWQRCSRFYADDLPASSHRVSDDGLSVSSHPKANHGVRHFDGNEPRACAHPSLAFDIAHRVRSLEGVFHSALRDVGIEIFL
jgi:hypothetical protein